jgi:hypothetical protein
MTTYVHEGAEERREDDDLLKQMYRACGGEVHHPDGVHGPRQHPVHVAQDDQERPVAGRRVRAVEERRQAGRCSTRSPSGTSRRSSARGHAVRRRRRRGGGTAERWRNLPDWPAVGGDGLAAPGFRGLMMVPGRCPGNQSTWAAASDASTMATRFDMVGAFLIGYHQNVSAHFVVHRLPFYTKPTGDN